MTMMKLLLLICILINLIVLIYSKRRTLKSLKSNYKTYENLIDRSLYGNNTNNNTTKNNIRRRLFTDAKIPNDHKVNNLPGLTGDLVHYAGHLMVDKQKQGYIFYWLFEKPKNPEAAPLLLWY